jgi:23S rRNA pseudouridine2605 synthase
MTEQEMLERRRVKWRINGNPILTLEDAQSFIKDVGFSLMYPVRPTRLAPTFFGATLGSDERLPLQAQAFGDPRSQAASALMVRLLRARSAYETNIFGETPFLVSGAVFPFLYAMITDRNPKQPPRKRGREKASPLMVDTFKLLQERGPLNKMQLRQRLGGDLSEAAVDHALHDLWSALKITRVDYSPEHGASWDVLHRWAPEAVREGVHLSTGESLSALISQYVDCLIAAEQKEVEEFFSAIAPLSRVRETVNALLNAREFQLVRVGDRSLITSSHLFTEKATNNRRSPNSGHEKSPAAVFSREGRNG